MFKTIVLIVVLAASASFGASIGDCIQALRRAGPSEWGNISESMFFKMPNGFEATLILSNYNKRTGAPTPHNTYLEFYRHSVGTMVGAKYTSAIKKNFFNKYHFSNNHKTITLIGDDHSSASKLIIELNRPYVHWESAPNLDIKSIYYHTKKENEVRQLDLKYEIPGTLIDEVFHGPVAAEVLQVIPAEILAWGKATRDDLPRANVEATYRGASFRRRRDGILDLYLHNMSPSAMAYLRIGLRKFGLRATHPIFL